MYSNDANNYPDWIKNAIKAAIDGETVEVEFTSNSAAESGRSRAYAYLQILNKNGTSMHGQGIRIKRSHNRLEIAPRFNNTTNQPQVRIIGGKDKKQSTDNLEAGLQQLIDKHNLTIKTLNVGDTKYWTITNNTPFDEYQYKPTLQEAIQAWADRTGVVLGLSG